MIEVRGRYGQENSKPRQAIANTATVLNIAERNVGTFKDMMGDRRDASFVFASSIDFPQRNISRLPQD
jgi:hypothetical protein